MTNIPKFSLKGNNGYKQILVDWLHYRMVAYQTSNIPGEYPIIPSDTFFILQFDSHFRIWRDF